jgi:regulator of ribonuclease activity A
MLQVALSASKRTNIFQHLCNITKNTTIRSICTHNNTGNNRSIYSYSYSYSYLQQSSLPFHSNTSSNNRSHSQSTTHTQFKNMSTTTTSNTNPSNPNSNPSTSIATADLCDTYIKSPQRLNIADPSICKFYSYGQKTSFSGPIETIRCYESNPLVRETLEVEGGGKGRVLVVDGGGSTRCAILGDMLASMAVSNNWAGLIINGCIRDSKVINSLNIGVKALGTHPLKSIKDYKGESGGRVTFAGVEFVPGHWLYSDEDGIIISEKELELPAKL